MRIIGLDLGERRIGVAAADDRTMVAVPIAAVQAGEDAIDAITKVVREQQADEVVVGLPLSLSGAMGPQARRAMAVVATLRRELGVPVHTMDERLTSAQADRSARPAGRGRRGRPPEGTRDAIAAAIILQAFLDGRRHAQAGSHQSSAGP